MLDRLLLGADAAGITFIASASGTSSASPTTCNKPTGTAQGDLMIAFMYADGSNAWTAPTGWTQVVNADLSVMYKVAGASEGSSYSFTSSKAGFRYVAIFTYRNAAYDVVGTTTTATTATVSIPAITLSSNASTVFAFVGGTGNVTGWNTPSGFTALLSSASNPIAASFSKADVASGSTGTVSLTRTGSSTSSQIAVLVGIKPL